MITGFINWVIESVAFIIDGILTLLPTTPFEWDIIKLITESDFWGIVNYFIPFDVIASIMLTYVTAVVLWYAIRWILRFVKFIG